MRPELVVARQVGVGRLPPSGRFGEGSDATVDRAPSARSRSPPGDFAYSWDAMSKVRRPHRNGKPPKRPACDSAVKTSHQDSPNAEARTRVERSGRNTIPVQAEWLEPDGESQATVSTPRTEAVAGRGSRPGSRAGAIRAAPPPLPADIIIDASQLALQRLQAIHPARDNERLVDELARTLRAAVNGAFVKATTYQGNVALLLSVDAFFASDGTSLLAEGIESIAEFGRALSAVAGARFRVEAHAGATHGPELGLCVSRVAEVARRLVATGISAGAISIAIFGELGGLAPPQRDIVIEIRRGAAGPRAAEV
jgi:outer membrane protein OmpA-like peptidoglycan-associated protein